jgi:alanine dehydrogenase
MSITPDLRYLDAHDVARSMPSLPERLALAERTLLGLAGRAELPAKIAVHPRPDGSFAHAMPAFLPGEDADGSADQLGMKWVLGFSTNGTLGLPAISGLLLLNDPVTGLPTGILDAGPITAQRTAAVSGVAIRVWAPVVAGRPHRAALVGAGVQGHSHVPVLGHVLPGVDLVLYDRSPERAESLAETARGTEGIGTARVVGSAREAVDGADVVITAASFVAPPERQVMTNDWLAPRALVVPVDYATYCSAEVAREAAMFLVDHREQFLANRDAGQFDDYPDPTAMFGERLGAPRPDGRVVATHLGTGLADVVFGTAILVAAAAAGRGTMLSR